MASGGGFVEEMMREQQSLLQATCGDLFDHIDDLLDFSKEDDVLLLDAPAPGSPIAARIIDVGPRTAAGTNADVVAPPPPPAQDGDLFGAHAFNKDGATGQHIGSCDDLDMAQLEWLSGLFDDASIPHDPAAFPVPPIKSCALAANAGVPMLGLPDKLDDAIFRSSSPISVLEQHTPGFLTNATNNSNNVASASSSSSSSSSSSVWSAPVSPRQDPPPALVIPARARSKRSRASAFTGGRAAEAPVTILVPTPMYSATSSHSDPESIAESAPQSPKNKKKKKAKKPAAPAAPAASDAEGDADGDADYVEGGERAQGGAAVVRRCTHCQIDKTPQWRAGPLGPKTLCNACGVRYKSGRLFPEYRPAASPTFVPSIHSNSHKKVVEMRQKAVRSGDPSCDLLQFIRRRE